MTERRMTFAQWRAALPAVRARSDALVRSFGEIRRDKPRDPVEAEMLRRIRTPERLIGPVRRS